MLCLKDKLLSVKSGVNATHFTPLKVEAVACSLS